MDCSTSGLPIPHHLLEFTQVHVHWISDVVQPSILCCPLLLLPSIFPSFRIFSNEFALHIRWPKYWSFYFSIGPSNEYSRLISFRMDWLDLLAVQGTLKSLLQHQSFPFYCFPLFLCIVHLGRLSYLSLLFFGTLHLVGYNFPFFPLPFPSLLFSAICKALSDNHFAFLHFFFLGMVLITAYCTMSGTSIHSSSGTLFIRSNPLNLFVTSTVYS